MRGRATHQRQVHGALLAARGQRFEQRDKRPRAVLFDAHVQLCSARERVHDDAAGRGDLFGEKLERVAPSDASTELGERDHYGLLLLNSQVNAVALRALRDP